MVRKRRKKNLRKKLFKIKTNLNFEPTQMSVAKGKIFGGYMILLALVMTFMIAIVAQKAYHCKLNYNISQLQQEKLRLNDEYKLVLLENSELTNKERIISLAQKQGLIIPSENVVMLLSLAE